MYNRMYKNIDPTLSKTLRISSKREYYYFDNNEKKYIQEEKIDSIKDINAYELVDENEEWNSKNQSLFYQSRKDKKNNTRKLRNLHIAHRSLECHHPHFESRYHKNRKVPHNLPLNHISLNFQRTS